MMSKDGRICFIVVPDKKYYGKYDFSDFMAAILNFMFYKKTSTRIRHHIRPYISIGEPAKHNQNRKNTIAIMRILGRQQVLKNAIFLH